MKCRTDNFELSKLNEKVSILEAILPNFRPAEYVFTTLLQEYYSLVSSDHSSSTKCPWKAAGDQVQSRKLHL
jgi:hypothetical protein